MDKQNSIEESVEDILEQQELLKKKIAQVKANSNDKISATTANVLQVMSEFPLLSNARIVEKFMDVFEISRPKAYSCLNKAYVEINKRAKENIDAKTGEFFKRYEDLIEINENNEDYKEVRAVLKDYSELLGIRSAKIELNGELGSLFASMDKLK